MSLELTEVTYRDEGDNRKSAKITSNRLPLAEFMIALNDDRLVTCLGRYDEREFGIWLQTSGKFMFIADLRGTAKKGAKKRAAEALQKVVVTIETLNVEAKLNYNIKANGIQVAEGCHLSHNHETDRPALSGEV